MEWELKLSREHGAEPIEDVEGPAVGKDRAAEAIEQCLMGVRKARKAAGKAKAKCS